MKSLTVSAVLFDFDGTLVDSINTGYAAVCKMFYSARLTPPTRDEWHDVFEPPWLPAYRQFGLMWSKEKIWDEYLKHAGYVHINAEFFPDVRPVLETLALKGVSTGIVSSQVEDIIKTLCQRAGILSGLSHLTGGCGDKASAILEYCDLMQVSPSRVVYVGDFGHDIRDAKRAGVVAVGITRGNVSEYIFRKNGADFTVTHLSDLMHMSIFAS